MWDLIFRWVYFIFAIIGVLVVLLFFATKTCGDGACIGTVDIRENDDDDDDDGEIRGNESQI